MDLFWEIFTLVTGIVYMVLEIKQKNFMWVVGVLTSAAAVYVFWTQHIYAQVGLNTYYFFVSFWGLWQWRMAQNKMSQGMQNNVLHDTQEKTEGGDKIHLRRLNAKTIVVSALIFVSGTLLLDKVLGLLPLIGLPAESMSWLDAGITVLSAIATWWLAKSYHEQWYLWIVADSTLAVMCFMQGMIPMGVLYIAYTIAAVLGTMHWRKCGVYIEEA